MCPENRKMAPRLKQILSVVLLLTGGLIYLLFRPTTLLLFRVAAWIGLTPVIEGARETVTNRHPDEFLVYCLPNGLWAMAYILVTDSLLQVHSTGTRLLVGAVIPLLGAFSELLQSFGLLRGTFDWLDLACYMVPYFLYIWILTQNKQIWI